MRRRARDGGENQGEAAQDLKLKYCDWYTRDRSGSLVPRGVSAFRSPRSSDSHRLGCFSSNPLLIPVFSQSASLPDAPTQLTSTSGNHLRAPCPHPECSQLKTCTLRTQSEISERIPTRFRPSLTVPGLTPWLVVWQYQVGKAQENRLDRPRWQAGMLHICHLT